MLEGKWQRDYVEEFQDGKPVSETLEEEIVKVVYAIVCPTCAVRFRILQDDVFRQKRDIVTLRRKLAELEAPKPAGEKKELIQ